MIYKSYMNLKGGTMTRRPSLREFSLFSKKVHAFFDIEQAVWADRLLFEGLEDVSFIKDVMPVLSSIERDFTHKDINFFSTFLRQKCDFYLDKVNNEKNLDKRFDYASKVMAYFGLTEVLHETGPFSERVFQQLQFQFGADYLKKLAEIDRQFLSVDGAKFLQKTACQNLPENLSEVVKQYVVLKLWQDDQHAYFPEKLDPFIWDLDMEYKNQMENAPYFPSAVRQINNVNAQKIRFLKYLANKELIPIDEISKAYLAGIDKELVKLVGGKGYGLAVLKANGLPIPETYVIPTTHTTPQLQPETLQVLPDIYQYAVRSSADIEDGSSYSFAGMFDSSLGVAKEDLVQHIRCVQDSVNNRRVNTYIKINELQSPHMAVIVQKFKEPAKAGVWIASSPDSGVLEWVNGNGEKLVSGKANPNREIWMDEQEIKNPLVVCGKPLGSLLVEMQKKVSKTGTADFEWCILDDELVMLQFRPVTKSAKLNELTQDIITDKNRDFKGTPASSGYAEGSAKFVRTIKELDKWNDGDILMAWFTDPDWMDILSKSSGVVTAIGGFLCHTAIIAREMGIPCVVGIGGDSMKKIWDKTYLSVDGTTGIVSTKKMENQKIIKRDIQHDR